MHFFKDQVRPPEKRWGDIARIYLYMDWAYPTQRILSEKQRQLYVAWDKIDPPDAWECLRTQRIENIQGNPNPFSGCKTTGLNKNTKISNGPIQ
jgi:deoxyribonuclease-1